MSNSQLPELHLYLLGGFRCLDGDIPLTGLNAPRLQSLTAYLLLHRAAPQSRQQIAFRFWPDTSDAQAQTNLRQLLHSLRQRLPRAGDYLAMDERTIQWRNDSDYTLDVAEFEAALLAASQSGGEAKIVALERAADLYTGDLLPGCYDEWVIPVRERLAQRFVVALEELVLLHEERRSYASAIAYAQRLLHYDPLHEATYRHLMRLFALTGERAAALRVYHTCVAALERELDAPPSPATQELYERLLGVNDALLPPRTAQLPLVGRHSDWSALQSLWQTANRGNLRVACIAGEAGLGKTRLAEELLHWAEQQGISTLQSRVYAAEGGLAYAPLVEWLRSPALQPAITRLAAVWRTELARLLPELLGADPSLPAPEPLTERWQRQRLFEAVERALVPDDRALILALDDLHWCDEETLAWLLFAIHRHPQSRLLLLATLRSDELISGGPVADFLLELRRLDLLSELALPPLDVAETIALAEAIIEQKLERAQADRLYAATEGNPLFVIETMRSQSNGAATFDAPLTLPPKVHGVIRARLAQLSPPSRELAGLAAVIGRSFTVDLLTAACEQDEATVVHSLDELWQRRIVRVQGTHGYDFSHERLCEVAYGEVPPARRRLLHRRVAAALEKLHPNAPAAVCVQLANHHEQSGLVEQAVYYLQRAADQAREIYAHRDTIALLERCLALLHTLPDEQTRLGLELEVQMALCGAWHTWKTHLGPEIEVAFTRALELCRLVPQTPHLFRVLWGLHSIALYRSDYRESITIATQCLRIAEEADDVGLLLQAHHALWAPYFYLGEYEQAFFYMEAGLAIYDQRQHESLSVHFGEHDAGGCALTQFPLGLWNRGYLEQARQRLASAIAHGRQLTISNNSADLYGYAALTYHLLREPVLAQQFAEPALQIYRQKGMNNSQFLSAITLGWSLTMQGQKTEGLALARYGLNICREGQHRLHMSQLMCMFAETCIAAGHFSEAIAAVDEAIAGFARSRDLICAPDLWTLKGDALLALGAADTEVEECYYAALLLAQELGAKTSELRAAVNLGRLWQTKGKTEDARRLIAGVYNWFTEGFETPDLRAARVLLSEFDSKIT